MPNGNRNEKEMNQEFVNIWDCEIIRRLRNGELHTEMDIQAVFRTELEKRGLTGEGKDEGILQF